MDLLGAFGGRRENDAKAGIAGNDVADQSVAIAGIECVIDLLDAGIGQMLLVIAQAVSYAEADLSSAIEDLFYEIAVENYCNASADYIEENVSGYRSAVPIEAHNMKNHEENTN